MSDDLLLTSLWLLPADRRRGRAGRAQASPKRRSSGSSLGVTSSPSSLTLVASGSMSATAREHAAAALAGVPATRSSNGRCGAELTEPTRRAPGDDLVVRRAWIPYFNIQYYLGLDGISLSLVVLTGLVSVLACLASWNIDKQVKGYFALFLLLMASMMGVFLVARPVPLLRVLRGDAPADVLPDRHLGRRQARVRGHQVPALHAVRLGLHPGRRADPLLLAGRACERAGLHGPLVRHRRADADRHRDGLLRARRSSGGSSSSSSSASASSCRRSRSTPGFPTPTCRPRRRSA